MTINRAAKVHQFFADDTFIVKIKGEKKWEFFAETMSFANALDIYNAAQTPRMLIGPKGIMHKQYSNDGFVYRPAFRQDKPVDFDYFDLDVDIDWDYIND